jgi:hypothetical protein
MAVSSIRPLGTIRLSPLALLAGILMLGCGDNSGVGPTFPVAGKVTLQNAPFSAKHTVIMFKPDASRGNSSLFTPSGTVDADGNYTLKTKGKNGAPPGWYKVVVSARDETPPEHPKTPKHRPVVKSLLPARYGQEKTTDLSIEVVENPATGTYDLKLRK